VEERPTVLVIEDDPDSREILSVSMKNESWNLAFAGSGEEGLARLGRKGAGCVILDLALPGMDGLHVLREMRARDAWRLIPVIIASARGEDSDVIAALELGADDYVIKPYSAKVLAARVRAAMRRRAEGSREKAARSWRHESLSLDDERHAAFLGERELYLLPTEFALLRHFISHPDIVFTRSSLIAAIKGPDYPATDRSVDVQILGLRRKLGEAGPMIETVRGIGYKLGTGK